MKRLHLFLILCLFTIVCSAETADSLRVLWIGNSFTFTNDLPEMVQKIASSKNMKLSCTRALVGGEQLSGHLKRQNLLDHLKRGGWDYVVIQEQSSNPALPTQQVITKTYPYAQKLCELAKANSPKVKIIFFMTWAHKYGNKNYVKNYPLDDTYEGMQERLKISYLEMTYDNNAWCAPVGMAWKKVREERPNLVLYHHDLEHPSVIGSYIAANVFFTTIYQRQYQTDFTAELSIEDAEYIQQVAQKTVLENLNLLNIKREKE